MQVWGFSFMAMGMLRTDGRIDAIPGLKLIDYLSSERAEIKITQFSVIKKHCFICLLCPYGCKNWHAKIGM